MTAADSKGIELSVRHFAYLRAVSEGLPATDAAARYLDATNAREGRAAHREVVQRVQALARQRGNPRWRLLGAEINDSSAPASDKPPPLDEWAAAEGLEDWSHAELVELYAERFAAPDASSERRARRNARLRSQRLELLRELETSVAVRPLPGDAVERWLAPPVAQALTALGTGTLAQLDQRIARGGRWWRGLPAYGPVKAERLRVLLEQLIGKQVVPTWSRGDVTTALERLTGKPGAQHGPGAADFGWSDRLAVAGWVEASARSMHTARSYRREADRFLSWCALLRGQGLGEVGPETCRLYQDFLAEIPDGWIGKGTAVATSGAWRPFRDQLKPASQRAAVEVLRAMGAWLGQRGYLKANPWRDVADSKNDPPKRGPRRSACLAERLLEPEDPTASSPSGARIAWLRAMAAAGLKPSVLVTARRGDVQLLPGGAALHVRRSTGEVRTLALSPAALDATRHYFAIRGLNFADAADSTPLLSSLVTPNTFVSLRALHETLARAVRKATQPHPANSLRLGG